MKDFCLISPDKDFAIGNSDFITLRRERCFVDKSLFIKEILNDSSRIILITRPPRFGKTLSMKMLEAFLDHKREDEVLTLFKELLIWDIDQGKYQEDASKYSVIFLTFLNLDYSSGEQFYESMLSYIGEVYENYFDNKFEKELTEEELTYYDRVIDGNIKEKEFYDALYRLTQFLQKVYKREVIILIDEYDAPIQIFLQGSDNRGGIDTITSLIQKLFKSLLRQDNAAFKKVVITGIVCLDKESFLSGTDNVNICNGLYNDSYGSYFGFTTSEVQTIFKEKKMKFDDKLQKYYGGYRIGHYKLYNPWSILGFIKVNQKRISLEDYDYGSYWVEQIKNKKTETMLLNVEQSLWNEFERLLQADQSASCKLDYDEVTIQPRRSSKAYFWQLLYFYGYLTSRVDHNSSNTCVNLFFPNLEVAKYFQRFVLNWRSMQNCEKQNIENKNLTFWKTKSTNVQLTCEKTFKGHEGPIFTVVQLRNGSILSGSHDTTIKFWDIENGQCLKTVKKHTSMVRTLIQLKDGRVASGSDDNHIKVLDIENDENSIILNGHTGSIRVLTQLQDGKLASGSGDKTIKIWDLENGKCFKTLKGHKDCIFALAQLQNGCLISASDNTIKIWNIETGKIINTLNGHTKTVYALVQLDNKKFVSASYDTNINIWDLESGKCIQILKGHTDKVSTVIQLRDGHLVSGSNDKTIKIWDIESGQCLNTLEGHTSLIYTLIQLKDGRVVSGAGDRTLKLWGSSKYSYGCDIEKVRDNIETIANLNVGLQLD